MNSDLNFYGMRPKIFILWSYFQTIIFGEDLKKVLNFFGFVTKKGNYFVDQKFLGLTM